MTLTQTAILIRRGTIVALIAVVLVIIGAVGYKIWHQYYLSSLPPVEEKPEMKFGVLPKLNFPPSMVSSSNFSYSLDTVTGGLPQTPQLLKVYFIPQSGVSFLAPEKSKTLAQNLGFPIGPQIISASQYKFTDENTNELTIDLTNSNFHFQTSITENGTATSSADLKNLSNQTSNQVKLIDDFKSYLSSKNLLREELQNGRSYAAFGENTIVSIWPVNLDNLPIVSASPNQSLVKTTITKTEKEEFIRLDYTFWVIDQTTFSTYKLKTSEQAFADLRSGLGFISLEPKKPEVSISSVYLAYFESEEYSPYLQPVFVFEGPDFAAIVPAVATATR